MTVWEASLPRDGHTAQVRKLREGGRNLSLDWLEREPGLPSGSELMTWRPSLLDLQNELLNF